MSARPVRLRERAAADIDQAVDYYLAEVDTNVALCFVDAVEWAVGKIGRSPHSGSLIGPPRVLEIAAAVSGRSRVPNPRDHDDNSPARR